MRVVSTLLNGPTFFHDLEDLVHPGAILCDQQQPAEKLMEDLLGIHARAPSHIASKFRQQR